MHMGTPHGYKYMESQAYIHIVKCDIDNGWYRKVGCHDGLKSIMKEHSYFQLPILLIINRKLLTHTSWDSFYKWTKISSLEIYIFGLK